MVMRMTNSTQRMAYSVGFQLGSFSFSCDHLCSLAPHSLYPNKRSTSFLTYLAGKLESQSSWTHQHKEYVWSSQWRSISSHRPLSSRPGHVAALATTDACDANAALLACGDLRVLEPIFYIYGKKRAFSGPIVTVKVFEDNVLVKQLLETKGEGRVLVVDGGGSKRCALVGGNVGQLAENMGWAGIIVNGCIRDVEEINACEIGVRALASHPCKSSKKGVGDKHVPVYFAGSWIRDGEWLYADSDGIIVSKTELSW